MKMRAMNNLAPNQLPYETKRIVLLANSRKHNERCMAGREINSGLYAGWIRPVSARTGEGVDWYERAYATKTEPQLLDIVDVPIRKYKPHANQTENWLLYPHARWNKVGALTFAQATQLAETPAVLWNTGSSTNHNRNDKVSAASAKTFTNSICMIKVNALRVRVWAPGSDFGNNKRRVQASFSYNNILYSMWLTDAALEEYYYRQPNGIFNYGECLVTVSLSEPHATSNGEINHYKLVAAIIFSN